VHNLSCSLTLGGPSAVRLIELHSNLLGDVELVLVLPGVLSIPQ
jgi:hypothetical protein